MFHYSLTLENHAAICVNLTAFVILEMATEPNNLILKI